MEKNTTVSKSIRHMPKIKLCGLKRACDIAYANELAPEYVGFVFARGSRRYIAPAQAEALGKQLNKGIVPVGVFVNERIDAVMELLGRHIIEAVQLHGSEDEAYIRALRKRAGCRIIKAFRVEGGEDIRAAEQSIADAVLLDSGGGSGEAFDWSLIEGIKRPYFLAGGLTPENVRAAIGRLQPYGVDASSCLETGGWKDREKMAAFVEAARSQNDADVGNGKDDV